MAGLAKSSGLVAATAATAVMAQPTILSGVTAISDGTNDATVIVYDNASAASGTVLAKVYADSTVGSNTVIFATPVKAEAGITISVTGTNSGGIVYYGA